MDNGVGQCIPVIMFPMLSTPPLKLSTPHAFACQQIKEGGYDVNEVHGEFNNFIISSSWEVSKSAFKYAK